MGRTRGAAGLGDEAEGRPRSGRPGGWPGDGGGHPSCGRPGERLADDRGDRGGHPLGSHKGGRWGGRLSGRPPPSGVRSGWRIATWEKQPSTGRSAMLNVGWTASGRRGGWAGKLPPVGTAICNTESTKLPHPLDGRAFILG